MNMERKVAASNFVWNDPFLLEDQLSEDERISYARNIIRISVPERPAHLRELFYEDGKMSR